MSKYQVVRIEDDFVLINTDNLNLATEMVDVYNKLVKDVEVKVIEVK